MKRLAINTLVNTAIIAISGIGIHTVFHDWFYAPEITGPVWRPEGPLRTFVIPGSLLMGYGIAALYAATARRAGSWTADGLRHGLRVFAFAFGFGILVTYGSSRIMSPLWILAEGGFVLSYCVATGLATAWFQREPG